MLMLPNNQRTCSILKPFFVHPAGKCKKFLAAKAQGTGTPPGTLVALANPEARKRQKQTNKKTKPVWVSIFEFLPQGSWVLDCVRKQGLEKDLDKFHPGASDYGTTFFF